MPVKTMSKCRNRLPDPKRAPGNTAGPICGEDAEYIVPGPIQPEDRTHMCKSCLVDKVLHAQWQVKLARQKVRAEEFTLDWLLGAWKDKQDGA